MGRGKVQIERISCNKRRRSVYLRRVAGLQKKVSQLSTLCGVDAIMISFSPDEVQPKIWPEDHSQVTRIIEKYKSKEENKKRKENLSRILPSRINYLNKEIKQKESMHGKKLGRLGCDSLRVVVGEADRKLAVVKERIRILETAKEILDAKIEEREERPAGDNDTPFPHHHHHQMAFTDPVQFLQPRPLSVFDPSKSYMGLGNLLNYDMGFQGTRSNSRSDCFITHDQLNPGKLLPVNSYFLLQDYEDFELSAQQLPQFTALDHCSF